MLSPLHFTCESLACTHSSPTWLLLAQLRPLNTREDKREIDREYTKHGSLGYKVGGPSSLTQPALPSTVLSHKGWGGCQALSLGLLQSFCLKILLFLTCWTSQTDS